VRFYLAIVVKGEQDVVVVFPSLLPRRVILEEVWRGARKCLWERDGVEQKHRGES
jgi:phosphatidylinositol glycan class H protein